MGRRKQDWTKAKFERYLKEGRGQGSGKDYKPWITIQDFPSKGRVSRTPGWRSDAFGYASQIAYIISCLIVN